MVPLLGPSTTRDEGGRFPEISDEASKAFNLPLGAASPLWLMFASAAGAGMAYWWMTRWTRPVNLEAWFGGRKALADAALAPEPAIPEPAIPEVAVGGESAPLAGAPAAVVEEAAEVVTKMADAVAPKEDPKPFVETASFLPPEPAPAMPAALKAEAVSKAEAPSKVEAAPKTEAAPAPKAKSKAPPAPEI